MGRGYFFICSYVYCDSSYKEKKIMKCFWKKVTMILVFQMAVQNMENQFILDIFFSGKNDHDFSFSNGSAEYGKSIHFGHIFQ